VVDFFGAEVPLPDKRDGVKLGESTLNRFLLLYIVADKLFVADTEVCRREERKIRLTYLLGLPHSLSEGRG
jgi:hypothetical protein